MITFMTLNNQADQNEVRAYLTCKLKPAKPDKKPLLSTAAHLSCPSNPTPIPDPPAHKMNLT